MGNKTNREKNQNILCYSQQKFNNHQSSVHNQHSFKQSGRLQLNVQHTKLNVVAITAEDTQASLNGTVINLVRMTSLISYAVLDNVQLQYFLEISFCFSSLFFNSQNPSQD